MYTVFAQTLLRAGIASGTLSEMILRPLQLPRPPKVPPAMIYHRLVFAGPRRMTTANPGSGSLRQISRKPNMAAKIEAQVVLTNSQKDAARSLLMRCFYCAATFSSTALAASVEGSPADRLYIIGPESVFATICLVVVLYRNAQRQEKKKSKASMDDE